ncbi:helix-turn-helix transcriptional regulator [Aestuariimicrobium ganziense]|uniref:helix-turn-helix transcriptional regulator n=1 Tax=Aestuariimicrobium ganziense TaxID=2773677 RepID=UPI001942DA04|nr:helix-turn-helix transcriptional regulator [Aestuariimicrobium ganziense]
MERSDVRDFLVTRRDRISPEQAGLPTFGGQRRVKGLRREEVAMLAGLSVDYYIRLERGNLRGASRQVLDALANALQLDDAERAHLHNLAAAQDPHPPRGARNAQPTHVRDSVQRALDAMDGAAAYVRNRRLDVIASNLLGRALYSPAFDELGPVPNLYRFTFLCDDSRTFFRDWDRLASDCVASLRLEVGRSPHDKGLSDLVGELSVHSPDFRTLWASQRVVQMKKGTKRYHHPAVGELELSFDGFDLVAEPCLRLNVYSPEPATTSAQNFALLATWAASREAVTNPLATNPQEDRHVEAAEVDHHPRAR